MTQSSRDKPITISPERLEEMRREMKRRLELKLDRERPVCPWPPPRYDEVFFEGTAWLNNHG